MWELSSVLHLWHRFPVSVCLLLLFYVAVNFTFTLMNYIVLHSALGFCINASSAYSHTVQTEANIFLRTVSPLIRTKCVLGSVSLICGKFCLGLTCSKR